MDGDALGGSEGEPVGLAEGETDGLPDGEYDGLYDGLSLGNPVGGGVGAQLLTIQKLLYSKLHLWSNSS